jgi:hypothetical protein
VCALLPCLLSLSLIVARHYLAQFAGAYLQPSDACGWEFSLWKFRSMYIDGDDILREHLKSSPRATTEWALSHKLAVDPA